MILFAVQSDDFVCSCVLYQLNVPFIELLLALNISWLWSVHVFWFSCPVLPFRERSNLQPVMQLFISKVIRVLSRFAPQSTVEVIGPTRPG